VVVYGFSNLGIEIFGGGPCCGMEIVGFYEVLCIGVALQNG